MLNEQQNNEEEVDLGSLFVIIGQGFSKLFAFIGNVFRGIFDFFIHVLLFLRMNILKIGLAVLIGAIVGAFLDYYNATIYKSEMVVKPNFGSTKQLYTNIGYFNNLTLQKDKTKISQLFNLSLDEASSLRGFEIKPIKTEKDIVRSYNEVIISIDTLASKNYAYKDFKTSFTKFDYDMHTITVKSTKNNIFNKFNTTILKGIAENNYFKTIQKITLENIQRSDSIYRKDLVQIDSLRKLYAKVLLEESKKNISGTTINTGSTSSRDIKPKEIELFTTSKTINNELKYVNTERSKKSEIINIVSSFQNIGSKAGGLLSNNYLKFAILGGFLMTLFLLSLKLNSFLEKYKN